MRIRKSASRLLGSSYSAPAAPAPAAALELPPAPPPPPCLAPCSVPEYCGVGVPATTAGVPCELSRSPWDLIAELSISDPQVEDDLVDKYFVNVTCRASWLFSASLPAASPKKEKLAVAAAGDSSAHKKPPKVVMSNEKENKESEAKKKKKKVEDKKEEGEDGAARVWKCKKNDGKRWQCHRTVSHPNTLCKYHFEQKRSYLNPEFALEVAAEAAAAAAAAPASKPTTSSKPRKKKPSDDSGATEGFYYYSGFGPFRSKRHCRSTMHDSIPAPKQEEEEQPEDASPPNQAQADAAATNNRATARDDDVPSHDFFAGIAGLDEESSDDDDRLGTLGRNMNGNGEYRVGNGDSKRNNPWKRWRKPVKARSLKSLM